jgi:hypothetical protein
MQNPSSLQKQNAQWFALQRQTLQDELLNAKPRDYQERNWFYQIAAILISYPLQTVSILAGAYLLFDVASFVWKLPSYSWASTGIFAGCAFIFLLIELLRRWLVDTVGFHYIATFCIENNKIVRGEWLRTKILVLGCISVGLVSAGTFGAYQYSKNHAPQAEVINISSATSPLSAQIKTEKQHVEQLNKTIADLQQTKKRELADGRSYASWNGKEYLLPEVKGRHQNYDTQIAQTQRQVQTHLELLQKYEQKLSSKEHSLEQENKNTTVLNHLSKEQYALACAGIWLTFESLLLFSLAYIWLYRYGVKRELLLSKIRAIPTTKTQPFQPAKQENLLEKKDDATLKSDGATVVGTAKRTQNVALKSDSATVVATVKYAQNATVENDNATVKYAQNATVKSDSATVESDSATVENDRRKIRIATVKNNKIGFEIGRSNVPSQNDENFTIQCRNCGKSATMKSAKAVHCSDACRKEYSRKNREKNTSLGE